ncbi:MAG: hypothetical protein LBV32_11160 [Tannerellaceae bacterium]|jgi:hypothetical protein|nr:hypothetical protein [Tannerellaceae bacterium]
MKSKRIKVCLLCLFVSLSVYGQVAVTDSLQTILQNDTVQAETRFINAYNLLFQQSSPEEAESLGMNLLYPFVRDHWKTESEQLSHLSRIYLMIGGCHRERGGGDRNEKERLFFEKALDTARKSGDHAVYARCCTFLAYMEMKRGDVKQAHQYLYQGIEYYDKMGMYVKSSEMLYVVAGNFFEIKDTGGMKRVLRQMEEYLGKDTSKQSLYQYNVIRKSYFEILLEKEEKEKGTLNPQRVDSVMLLIRDNIELVDHFLDELDPNWMHGYAYYYLAKALYNYYPEQTDSIFPCLDKALALMEKEHHSRTNEASSVMELRIHISQIRSKTLTHEGKMQESYQAMNESLQLLDRLKDYQNLNEQRNVAHTFMADYYEKNGRPTEALKFQKLLRESESKRYETEKVQAINDMSAKYETEKKEAQIHTLIREYETARHISWLTAGLILILLIALLLFIRFYKLRKKNLEQSVYESALLAELKQHELEQTLQEAEQLRLQYSEMELRADLYKQKPTKAMIGKLTEWISKSLMDKAKKDACIRKLSTLDIDMLEQGYLTADEKITSMDMKYIICFSIDMDVKDISLLFNVEPASIRTVRYRIKKKFGEKNTFKFLI